LVINKSSSLTGNCRDLELRQVPTQRYRDIVQGILAGALATFILSLLTLSKELIPQFELVTLLIGVARAILYDSGLPAPFAGWLWLFAIGGLWWGAWFAIIAPILPGRSFSIKGAAFGLVIGLAVIWTVMPLAAAGALGMELNLWQPLVTLLEHLIYGLSLGWIYGRLASQ